MKPQNSEASRRQFERRRLLQPAFVRTPNQKLIPCVIENISTGGAFLEFEATKPEENSLQLITCSGLGTIQCEVRHRNSDGFGVQFGLI